MSYLIQNHRRLASFIAHIFNIKHDLLRSRTDLLSIDQEFISNSIERKKKST